MIDNVADKNPSNDWGQTPLHIAAEKGFVEICQLLIQNAPDKNPSDKYGQTPMHCAFKNGFLATGWPKISK